MLLAIQMAFIITFLPKEEYGKSFETIGNPVEAGVPEKIVCQLMEMGHSLDKKYQE